MAELKSITKRPGSRKGKKQWRRNIDLTDVESGLQAKAQKKVVTGSLVEKHKDKDIFFVDETKGAKDITFGQELVDDKYVPTISVPEISRKRKAAVQEGSAKKIEAKVAGRVLPKNSTQTVGYCFGKEDTTFDLWAGHKTGINRRSSRIKKAAVLSKPVFTVPHPGSSYAAVTQEAEELKTIQSLPKTKTLPEKILKRRKFDKLVKKTKAKEKKRLERQMKSVSTKKKSKETTPKDDLLPILPTERKTTAQRNKEKRIKELKIQKAQKNARKDLNIQMEHMDKTIKKVERRHKYLEARKLKRKQEREEQKLKPLTKIGKHRIMEYKEPVCLPTEGARSFNKIKPSGNLFKEGFAGLQKKNLIEPRVKASRKSTKKKVHPDWMREIYEDADANPQL